MLKLLTKVFGTKTERELKSLWPIVEEINQHYEEFKDVDLIQKTEEFKKRIANGETLDELMPEAFAAVKEACRRLVGKKWPVVEIETEWRMIPFDVQLIGAIVLHQGRIAEMKTGEGKTLVAPMPLYLNSLTGKGGHLVTVNDYLAKRDPHWMGPIYHLLGVSVSCIQHEAAFVYDPDHESEDEKWKGLRPVRRREAYEADIT